MQKPSVVIFTTAYMPFVGGAEIAVQEIARRMRGDFHFIVITSRFRRDLPQYEQRDGVDIYRVGLGTRFDKWFLLVGGVWRAFCVARKDNSLAAVFGLDLSQGSVAAALFKFFHPTVPFIFNIQYGYGEERIQTGRGGSIGLALRFILQMADTVTAISSYLGDLVRTYGYRGPIEIIPNGVDYVQFENHTPRVQARKEKIIITTSRLVSKNGIDILIDAIAEVRTRIPEVRCYILGDGPERVELEARVKEKKITDSITFFGNIPYEELPRYLHEADVFVRTSRSEGMGNSFVEALAAGIPVIGTSVGGIPDIIQDGVTGFIVPPDDARACAEKIIFVLQNVAKAHETVVRGQQYIRERFSWDLIVQKYRSLFEKIHGRQFRIVIATPLFPPQLGGPARYAHHLADEFREMGHYVSVVSFGSFLHWPSGIRHVFYARKLFWQSRSADGMLILDYMSVGLPAVFVSKCTGTPLVARVEGDFLWERFVERTRTDVTLQKFYSMPPALSWKEQMIKKIQGYVLRQCAQLVFSSEWRRKMVCDAFQIHLEKTALIQNVWNSKTAIESNTRKPVILWAGRMLYLKNLTRLVRVFERMQSAEYELYLVGDGPERARLREYVAQNKIHNIRIAPPASEEQLRAYISSSAFFVLPSLSDVGPNVIADAVSTYTPFLMTRESGFYEYLKDVGVFCDPLNEQDIEEKLRFLMNPAKREEYENKLRTISLQQTWKQAAVQWIKILRSFEKSHE